MTRDCSRIAARRRQIAAFLRALDADLVLVFAGSRLRRRRALDLLADEFRAEGVRTRSFATSPLGGRSAQVLRTLEGEAVDVVLVPDSARTRWLRHVTDSIVTKLRLPALALDIRPDADLPGAPSIAAPFDHVVVSVPADRAADHLVSVGERVAQPLSCELTVVELLDSEALGAVSHRRRGSLASYEEAVNEAERELDRTTRDASPHLHREVRAGDWVSEMRRVVRPFRSPLVLIDPRDARGARDAVLPSRMRRAIESVACSVLAVPNRKPLLSGGMS